VRNWALGANAKLALGVSAKLGLGARQC